MSRGGAKKACQMRMCVICRRRFPMRELARHVLDENGVLRHDVGRVLPGRGWYCCADAQCAVKFVKFVPKRRHAPKK